MYLLSYITKIAIYHSSKWRLGHSHQARPLGDGAAALGPRRQVGPQVQETNAFPIKKIHLAFPRKPALAACFCPQSEARAQSYPKYVFMISFNIIS
jgi:hypothetical protein